MAANISARLAVVMRLIFDAKRIAKTEMRMSFGARFWTKFNASIGPRRKMTDVTRVTKLTVTVIER